MSSLTPLLLAALLPGEIRAAASAWSDHEVVSARLVAAEPARGGELRLGLHVRLARGWHVYWRHAGDAGLPPEVVLTSDVPLGPPRLLFPAPQRYRLRGGLVANGYDREVIYPVRVSGTGAAAPRRIAASVDYLACKDECIPFHDDLALALDGDGAGDESELLARWEARLPVPLSEVPGASARAEYRGDGAGGELALTLEGRRVEEVFVAPIAGVVVGIPRWQDAAAPARALVELRPESAGRMPARLSVSFVATGVAGAGAGEAMEGRVEVSTTATGRAGPATDPPARDAAEAGTARGALATLLRGAALALTPGSLAALALLARAPLRNRRWGVPALAVAGAALTLGAAGLCARLAGNALILVEPPVLAALAVPQLVLALALWWGAGPHLARAVAGWGAVLVPLLALPFVTAVSGANASMDAMPIALMAAGFGAPVVGAVAWRRSPVEASRRGEPTPAAGSAALLGFLPAASLAWISYRLLLALPSVRLAGIQLAWLAAALAAFLGHTARPSGRLAWWTLAAAALASSVWLAR